MFLDQSIKEKERKKKKKKLDKNISAKAEVAERYAQVYIYIATGFSREVKNSRGRRIEIGEKKERWGKGRDREG